MGRIKTSTLLVISVGAALLLGGCGGSNQARSMEIKEGQTLLVNPAMLEKGTGDQALYRYANPKADIKKFTKVIIEPVIISKSAELDAGDLENYQKLANNAFVYLLIDTGMNVPRFLALGIVVGHLYEKLNGGA